MFSFLLNKIVHWLCFFFFFQLFEFEYLINKKISLKNHSKKKLLKEKNKYKTPIQNGYGVICLAYFYWLNNPFDYS